MGKLKEISVSAARPLPVIVLADSSGSMGPDGKIEALNGALAEMIAAFSEEENQLAEIQVAVISFGGRVDLHLPMTAAAALSWSPMRAEGNTPLGAALTVARKMLEERQQAMAYTPTLVLVSDGLPNDEWQQPLADLHRSARASRAQRFALAIGADADEEMLRTFLGDPEGRVLQAHEAREIRSFFHWITMSVTATARGSNPGRPVTTAPAQPDDQGDF